MITSTEFLQFATVLLAGGGLGGIITAVMRSRRERMLARHAIGLEDFRLFQKTWRDEMQRLHREIAELRAIVLGLSSEVERLGGDPYAVRAAVRAGTSPKENPDADTTDDPQAPAG